MTIKIDRKGSAGALLKHAPTDSQVDGSIHLHMLPSEIRIHIIIIR